MEISESTNRARRPGAIRRTLNAVGRDRLAAASWDEARQMELCGWMWLARQLGLIAILVVGIAHDGFGRTDLVVLLAAVLTAGLYVVARGVSGAVGTITVLDAVLLVALTLAGLPPLAVLLSGVVILAWAAGFRPTYAAAAYVGVAAAVVLLYVKGESPRPWLAAASFCLLGAILVVRAVRLNMAARRGDQHERLITDSVDAMIWELQPDGGYRITDNSERILGYPAERWLEPGFAMTVVHPDDVAMVDQPPDEDDPQPRTCRMRHANGSWRWMEHRITSVRDAQGRHGFFAGVSIDRTDQMEAERDVLALGQLVQRSPIGQMLVSHDGHDSVVVAANRTSAGILGTAGHMVGRSITSLDRADPSIAELVSWIGRILSGEHAKGTFEFRNATGNAYQTTVRAVGESSCAVDFLDITERVEAGRLLFEQARRDELTGLPNRRAVLEFLEERISAAPDAALALLAVDLNAFKEINEALGHETGDRLLGQIAERVLDGRPAGHGYAGRQGGDEFAVVLSGPAAERARAIADAMVARISEPVMVEGLRLRVGASIGIARYPADADSVAELIRRADIALYRAKQRGLQVDVYEPDSDPFSRGRLGLVGDLETAIAGQELHLRHQPVIDVASGRIVGSETLCRWTHPTIGPVAPGVFIELAESSNQIRDLTRWVLRTAIADLAELCALDPDFQTSVNLSVRNLYEADLVPEISRMLADAGVAPGRLVLEITEGSFMDDQAAGVDVLESLRDLGVCTWIDDFGTGHSSFARLRSLPLDGVKIDRSFVSGQGEESGGVVLGSMIELVHALGLRVVAEGVETPAQYEAVTRFGADNAQGYLLGRPVGVDDLCARLRQGASVRMDAGDGPPQRALATGRAPDR